MELKFRAYHKEQKRMIDVYGLGVDFITENTLNGVDPGFNAFNDLSRIEVMQFTGITDKNGNPVFASDIVKCPKGRNDVIDFKYGSAWLRYRNCTLYRFLVELKSTIDVIGNEFENPELL